MRCVENLFINSEAGQGTQDNAGRSSVDRQRQKWPDCMKTRLMEEKAVLFILVGGVFLPAQRLTALFSTCVSNFALPSCSRHASSLNAPQAEGCLPKRSP